MAVISPFCCFCRSHVNKVGSTRVVVGNGVNGVHPECVASLLAVCLLREERVWVLRRGGWEKVA